MKILDSKTLPSEGYVFTAAVRRSTPGAVCRMTEDFTLDGVEGKKGDWLVKELGKFKIVSGLEYSTKYARDGAFAVGKPDKRRVPAVGSSVIAEADLVTVGRRKLTTVRKQRESSTYFIDSLETQVNREEVPFSYLTLHDPFTDPTEVNGAFVEDVIDVLIDHLESVRVKPHHAHVTEAQILLQKVKQIVLKSGVIRQPHGKVAKKS